MNKYNLSNIEIGLEKSFKEKIDLSKMNNFLDISNDINPLHVDSIYAKKKGFNDRVVHGLLTSSFYSTLVGVHLPGKNCFLHEIKIQFLKPVYIDDTVEISGTIDYINEAFKQIEINASITNQDNIRVSKAIIKVGGMDD